MKRLFTLFLILSLLTASCAARAEDPFSRFLDSVREPAAGIADAAGDLFDSLLDEADEGLRSLSGWAEEMIGTYVDPVLEAAAEIAASAAEWLDTAAEDLPALWEDVTAQLGLAAEEAQEFAERLSEYAEAHSVDSDTMLRLGLALTVRVLLGDTATSAAENLMLADAVFDLLEEYGISDQQSAEDALGLLLE